MPLAKARGARRRKSDSPPPPPLSAATDRQLRDVLAVLAGADAPRVSQLSGVFAPPTEGPLCVSLAGVVRGLLDASAAYSTAGKMGLPVFMSGEQYGSREAKDFFDARVLVFDLDNPVNPVTHDALRALGLLAFAYDTASSITKRPRQRLVVVLDRDASAAEYRRLGALVASRLAALGIFVSPESFEHARVFFLPARSEFMDGGEPHRWRPCAFAGEPLPVDRWLAALDAFEQEQGMALVAVLGAAQEAAPEAGRDAEEPDPSRAGSPGRSADLDPGEGRVQGPGPEAQERAVQIARSAPASRSGERGRDALREAAREITDATGLTGAGLVAVLVNYFSPRCTLAKARTRPERRIPVGGPYPWREREIARLVTARRPGTSGPRRVDRSGAAATLATRATLPLSLDQSTRRVYDPAAPIERRFATAQEARVRDLRLRGMHAVGAAALAKLRLRSDSCLPAAWRDLSSRLADGPAHASRRDLALALGCDEPTAGRALRCFVSLGVLEVQRPAIGG